MPVPSPLCLASLRPSPFPYDLCLGSIAMSGWLAALKVDAPAVAAVSTPVAELGKTKVVVDTNAIVKGLRLERLAEECVTIPEVLREIKDKQARHTLANLPFELKVVDPDDESIKAVRRFARLTGDLGALSDPDIRCIALHYMLEKEAHGLGNIRTEPPPLVLSKHKHSKSKQQPGWDFVEHEDEWAELDAMNAEAERNADEVEKRMASASLEPEPEQQKKLPPTAMLALEMKQRLVKNRAKAKETEALLKGEFGGGEDEDESKKTEGNQDDGSDSDDDGDGDGWSQNVSRTTRIRRARRVARKAELVAERGAAAAAEKREGEVDEGKQQGEREGVDSKPVTDSVEKETEAEIAARKDRYAKSRKDQDESSAFFSGTLTTTNLPEEKAEGGTEDDETDDEEEEEEGPSGSDDGNDGDAEKTLHESTIKSATADYAMQNVLLQMGLQLATPDGMLIRELRRWVLRCHACSHVTKETTRVFCAKCGNATLQKVQVSISRSPHTACLIAHTRTRRGHFLCPDCLSIHRDILVLRRDVFPLPVLFVHTSRRTRLTLSFVSYQHTVSETGAEQFGVRRKHKIRGTRFSLVAPKGGRREKAPILREDQLIGMRKVKNKGEQDVFAVEYNEESFAGSSRGNQPGTAHLYHQRDLMEQGGFPTKNPNERRFVRTNRRRK